MEEKEDENAESQKRHAEGYGGEMSEGMLLAAFQIVFIKGIFYLYIYHHH